MSRHAPTARLWAGPRDGEVFEVPLWPDAYQRMMGVLQAQGYCRASRVFHENMTVCTEVWDWRADR